MLTGRQTESVAHLFAEYRRGNREAVGDLFEALYPDLRRLARNKMRSERAGHTWQPTVLINELYLELLKSKPAADTGDYGSDRTAFLGLVSHMMKRLLIHHARPLSKRVVKADLGAAEHLKSTGSDAGALAQIEDLLDRLSSIDPRIRTVVELKVFQGLKNEEIAREMDCSPRTVVTLWSFAKHWLAQELNPDAASQS